MNRKIYILPFVIVTIFLALMTSLPGDQIPDAEIFKFDKLIHIIAYFCFGISLQFLLIGFSKIIHLKKLKLILIFVGAIYGWLDELHQIFIPGRSCSIFDWYADFIGIIISLLFIKRLLVLVEKINGKIL